MDKRSLTGYILWGLKESDTTESMHIHTHTPLSPSQFLTLQEFIIEERKKVGSKEQSHQMCPEGEKKSSK